MQHLIINCLYLYRHLLRFIAIFLKTLNLSRSKVFSRARFPAVTLLTAGLFCLSVPAQAEEVHLRAHHFLSTSAVTHKDLLQPWADKVDKLSGGKLKITVYPAMQLGGKAPQLFDQARRGTVDIAWTVAGYTPGRFPKMEVFELPFIAANAEITSQAAHEFYSKHARDEFKDVKVLMVHVHGPGKLHMRNKPIRSLADLKGAKVRAPSRITNLMLNSLGATAVGMPVPELPGALAKGVIDGALVPYEVTLPLRLHELADSHTDVAGKRGLYTAIFLLVMNKKKFEALPADLQRTLEYSTGLGWAKAAGKLWDDSDIPARQAAQARGNKFYFITGAELEKWKAIGTKVEQGWVEEMRKKEIDGASLVAKARELINKYEAAQ